MATTHERPLTDDDVHSPTAWKRDLIAAGWGEERHTVWKAPDGSLWRGPYGAWCELQRRLGPILTAPRSATGKEEAR